MNKVLIVSTNKYPQGDAGAIREESFALLFRKIGFDVLVVGLGESTGFQKKVYNGIEYISLRSNSEGLISRFLNRRMFIKRLERYIFEKENGFSVILLSCGSKQVIKYCKKQQESRPFTMIYDCVEWYSPEEFRFGKLSKAYRRNNEINTKIIDDSFRVISISSYLAEHYKARGILTERIPAILDIGAVDYSKELDENRITFLYAGMPGKKDSLSKVVTAFSQLTKEEKKRCELRIIGITEKQLIKDCGISKKIIEMAKGCIRCFGRVSRKEVLNQLREADFTVLLREANKRYAKAGFPTKFVESLATGTPVICNLSSDIEMYLFDGINGFICDNCSSEAMTRCIRKCFNMDFNKRQEMQQNARFTAEESFDYCKYYEEIKRLIY